MKIGVAFSVWVWYNVVRGIFFYPLQIGICEGESMNENLKGTIYACTNFLCFIILALIALFLIFHFIESLVLSIILSVISVIGAAYFEERILSRYVNSIIAFFLHDKF